MEAMDASSRLPLYAQLEQIIELQLSSGEKSVTQCGPL